MKKYFILILLIGLITIIGCNTQIPNPASKFCLDKGGTLKFVETNNGTQGICTLKEGVECDEWQYFRGECSEKFVIAQTTNSTCDKDYECVTPADYLIRSNCPYTSICINEKCAIICPRFDGQNYYDVKECRDCPQIPTPRPDFCKDGKIVYQKDDCGCDQPPACEQVYCTQDAKLCPDGSYVGRSPPDCAFDACPKTNITKKFVSNSPDECQTMLFQCISGASPFFDDTGCGCYGPKYYIGNSSDECSRIRYFCANQTVPFSDEYGCGCEFDWGDGKLKAYDCLPEQRNVACTKEYIPVCGWFNQSIQCIKYPCAATYGNKCDACSDGKVAYYTEGVCPE